jgi:PAS domain S-box-containing protein
MTWSILLLWPKPRLIWGHGIAILSVSTALILSTWPPLHLGSAPASLFLCAVMLAAWFGGFGPGLLAVALSSLAFDYYFLSPVHSLAAKPDEIPRFVVFILSSVFVGSLSVAQRSATEWLRRARDDLKGTVQELQSTNDALQTESRERVQMGNRLRRSEAYLAEAQRLTHTGSFGWSLQRGEIRWSDETFRIFECDPKAKPTLEVILQSTHPEDVAFVKETIGQVSQEQSDFDFEHRLLMRDGSIKYVRVVGHAVKDSSGQIEFVGALTDITSAKEAEGRTRLIIDTVPGQLWTESPEGVVDFVNGRWIDYTGMTLEQAIGWGWTNMVHPDDIERVISKWQKLIAEGKPREIESRLRRFDGTYRWFLSRCCPLVDRSGRILGWYGIDTDIHDRKEAEEKLRQSEAYLAEAQRLTQTGSWAYQAGGAPLFWSEETFRIWGFDPEQGAPNRETVLQRILPEDRDRARQRGEEAMRTKTDWYDEFRIVLPDGAVKHIQAIGHMVFNASGELIEVVGTHVDVTGRKRAEEALRRSEGYLAEAQRLSQTGSWASNISEIKYLSEECYRMLGFDPRGGLPSYETFFRRIHSEDQVKVKEAVESAERDKNEFEMDYRFDHPSGEIRDIHVVGHPVFSPNGELMEFLGTVIDITDRKRAEKERERLRQAQADLARVNRVTTIGELTASLAHEVNQPIAAALTNAKTCLRWLTRDNPDLHEAREAATRIVNDATRAAAIISRTRLLFKKGTPPRELVDVNEVIQEMILLLGSEAARYLVSIHADLGMDIPQVMADRVQLQQVLMNLMGNGIDAMKESDGTRELAIKSQRYENEHVLVSISDTGVGLPQQQAERLFDAFFTTKAHGTGMGLSISRSIVESHDGRLWADRNSPHGASFHFTLPTKVEGKE